jgi:hypothetical protein
LCSIAQHKFPPALLLHSSWWHDHMIHLGHVQESPTIVQTKFSIFLSHHSNLITCI